MLTCALQWLINIYIYRLLLLLYYFIIYIFIIYTYIEHVIMCICSHAHYIYTCYSAHSLIGIFSSRLHQVTKPPIFLTINANPPCQLSLWEETREPGENPRFSAVLTNSSHVRSDVRYRA